MNPRNSGFGRDHEPSENVSYDARATEKDEDYPTQADEADVETEVLGQTAADTAEDSFTL